MTTLNMQEKAKVPSLIVKRQTFYKNTTVALQSLGQSESTSHKLEVLLRVSGLVLGEWQMEALCTRILGIIFEEIPADRGIIFLRKGNTNIVYPAAFQMRQNQKLLHGMISRTIIGEVWKTKEGVLTHDAMHDRRFQDGLSINMQQIHAAICVPLVGKKENLLGIIHIDSLRYECSFTEDDLKLVTAIATLLAMAMENAMLVYQLTEQKRIEQELTIATSIQQQLLPRNIPCVEGIDVYGIMIPAREVGGDYYDFVVSENGRYLYVCIGDVSGKGIPAGLVMVMARCFCRSVIHSCSSTEKIMAEINQLLVADIRKGTFMSMLVFRWDVIEKELVWTGAGHEHVLVYRSHSRCCEKIPGGGLILGARQNAHEYFHEQQLVLASGDSVLLYTDGVTESMNQKREMFELSRLIKAVEKHGALSAADMCASVLREVKNFSGNTRQYDDITLVAIKKL